MADHRHHGGSFMRRASFGGSDAMSQYSKLTKLLLKTKVKELLDHNTNVVLVDMTTTIGKALETMHANKILSVPVYDGNKKKFTGMFDMQDAVGYSLQLLEKQQKREDRLSRRMSRAALEGSRSLASSSGGLIQINLSLAPTEGTSSPPTSSPHASPPPANSPLASPPNANSPIASPPRASSPVASPPRATSPLASPPRATSPVISPLRASSPVASPPNAHSPLWMSSPATSPTRISSPSASPPRHISPSKSEIEVVEDDTAEDDEIDEVREEEEKREIDCEFFDHHVSKAINLSGMDVFFPQSNEMSVYHLIELFTRGIHRVPVVGKDGQIINIVSQSSVAKLVARHLDLMDSSHANKTLAEYGFGEKPVVRVNGNVITAHAFQTLRNNAVDAVAIVDENDRLLSALSISNLRCLSKHSFGDLRKLTVLEFVKSNEQTKSPLQTCTADATLKDVFKQIERTAAHRIWIVDESKHIKNVVTLSDLMRLLLKIAMQPAKAMAVAKEKLKALA